ncbi:MAG: Gldg family protein [Armatimonadetes bacterium]|nr:Gldg family protein [Armatimonadota bacterium]
MSEDKIPQTDQRARGMAADPRLQQRAQTTLTGLLSIVAALFGGLTLIVGILWWLVSKTFGLWPKVFIIVAAVCFIYAIVVNFRSIVASFKQRRVVTGMNTAVFTVIIVGILVLLNVISVRHRFFRYDATENKQYSLSDQTRKVVKALDKDVQMIAFMSPEYPEYRQVRDRLEEYRALSPRLKVEYYDPHTRVDKVREYNVSVDGSVIIKAGDRKEDVMGGDEERITSAILAVTTGDKTKIYFLTGHGEFDPMELGQDSVNDIKRALETQQYAVETLSLLNKKDAVVPQDAAAVVIAGAQHPLQEAEMAALKKYADQGGKLFIALSNTPQAPDFSEILATRGVKPSKGKIMDPNAEHNAGTPTIPAVLRPESHEITRNLQGLVFPMAMALEVEETPPPPPSYPGAPPPPVDQKATALMKTSADAWLDNLGPTGKGNGSRDSGEASGPFVMAAAIDESKKDKPPTPPGMPPEPENEEEGPGTRIVVVADAEFMTDRLIEANRLWANAAFALNAINWLVGNEKLISIPPKETETPYLTMVGAQKAIATVLTIFVVPGLVVLAGGFVWWRRRR